MYKAVTLRRAPCSSACPFVDVQGLFLLLFFRFALRCLLCATPLIELQTGWSGATCQSFCTIGKHSQLHCLFGMSVKLQTLNNFVLLAKAGPKTGWINSEGGEWWWEGEGWQNRQGRVRSTEIFFSKKCSFHFDRWVSEICSVYFTCRLAICLKFKKSLKINCFPIKLKLKLWTWMVSQARPVEAGGKCGSAVQQPGQVLFNHERSSSTCNWKQIYCYMI